MAKQKGTVNAATKLRFEKAAQNQFDSEGVPSIFKDLNNVLRGKEPITASNVKNTLQLMFKSVKFRDDDGAVDRNKVKEFAEKRGYIPQAGKSYATTNLGDVITFFELLVTNYLSGKPQPKTETVEETKEVPPAKPEKKTRKPREAKLAKKKEVKENKVEDAEDESVTILSLLNKKVYELERRLDKMTDIIASLLPQGKAPKVEEGVRATKSGKMEKVTKITPADLEESEDDRFSTLSEKYDLSTVTEGTKLYEVVETLNEMESKRSLFEILNEIFMWPVEQIEEDFAGLSIEKIKEIVVN